MASWLWILALGNTSCVDVNSWLGLPVPSLKEDTISICPTGGQVWRHCELPGYGNWPNQGVAGPTWVWYAPGSTSALSTSPASFVQRVHSFSLPVSVFPQSQLTGDFSPWPPVLWACASSACINNACFSTFVGLYACVEKRVWILVRLCIHTLWVRGCTCMWRTEFNVRTTLHCFTLPIAAGPHNQSPGLADGLFLYSAFSRDLPSLPSRAGPPHSMSIYTSFWRSEFCSSYLYSKVFNC